MLLSIRIFAIPALLFTGMYAYSALPPGMYATLALPTIGMMTISAQKQNSYLLPSATNDSDGFALASRIPVAADPSYST